MEGTRHDGLLFSIARELIANATRHAGASHVDVTVTREDGEVVLLVEDDGGGIPPERARAAALNGHIGLAPAANEPPLREDRSRWRAVRGGDDGSRGRPDDPSEA